MQLNAGAPETRIATRSVFLDNLRTHLTIILILPTAASVAHSISLRALCSGPSCSDAVDLSNDLRVHAHPNRQNCRPSDIMASKRKASAMAATVSEEPVDPADELMFLCLGGGNEVGRSCHVVQYKGKTVMVCSPACLAPSLSIANNDLLPARRRSKPSL